MTNSGYYGGRKAARTGSWNHFIIHTRNVRFLNPLSIILINYIVIFSASVNKGVGVENYHYLNDGLWQMKPVK